MDIKYCIFDVGNVCYPYSIKYLNEYCREQSQNKEAFDAKNGFLSFDYRPFEKGEMDFSTFCKEICKHCYMEYSLEIEKQIDEKLHLGVGKFIPETLNLMNKIKLKGIGLCLLSNAFPNLEDTAPDLVAQDKRFLSYNLGLLKPDVEIYKSVLERLNTPPESVIFIDDKERNVIAAKSLGINAIVFNKDTIERDVLAILEL